MSPEGGRVPPPQIILNSWIEWSPTGTRTMTVSRFVFNPQFIHERGVRTEALLPCLIPSACLSFFYISVFVLLNICHFLSFSFFSTIFFVDSPSSSCSLLFCFLLFYSNFQSSLSDLVPLKLAQNLIVLVGKWKKQAEGVWGAEKRAKNT